MTAGVGEGAEDLVVVEVDIAEAEVALVAVEDEGEEVGFSIDGRRLYTAWIPRKRRSGGDEWKYMRNIQNVVLYSDKD